MERVVLCAGVTVSCERSRELFPSRVKSSGVRQKISSYYTITTFMKVLKEIRGIIICYGGVIYPRIRASTHNGVKFHEIGILG